MKTIKGLLFFCLLTSLLFAQNTTSNYLSGWSKSELAKANTAQNVTYLNTSEQKLILYINLVRLYPQKFMETSLKQYMKEKGWAPNNAYIRTLLKDLKTMQPVPAYVPSDLLSGCARAHAKELGERGKTGHASADGTSPFDRIKKALKGKNVQMSAENIQYGYEDPWDIFMDLLIDEGIEDLGHRYNLLDKDMNLIGIGQNKHSVYRLCTVMDFAKLFQ